MDSLLATYASSDEEEESLQNHQEQKLPNKSDHSSRFTGNSSKNPKISSVFSSLPPPKSSSSISFSLPPPKSNPPNPPPPQTLTNPFSSNLNQIGEEHEEDSPISASKIGGGPAKSSSSLLSALPQPKSSSLFSKLPEPKAQDSESKTLANSSSSSNPNPKKVVLFRPPINPSFFKSNDDEDEDDEDGEEQSRKSKKIESLNHTPTVKSFLSSIPAPKNSSALGALPNSSGTGRRSILEADVPSSNSNSVSTVSEESNSVHSDIGNYDHQSIDASSAEYTVGGADSSNWGSASEHYANYDSYGGVYTSHEGSASEVYANYGNNGSYGNYGHYENSWGDASVSTEFSPVVASDSLVKIPGKRGRSDIPHKIIEVKQDELIKNRPREDQTKLTGIAFGPSYQPVSTKGKPSKLHKRKHQIGSLYFDMRQKEMELAERRSKGFLTKAETQAKYGW